MTRIWRLLVVVSLGVLLVACGAKAWEQDPMVLAAKRACKDVGEVDRYACIERHAAEGLSPDVCRLLGIAVDDACLQSVYEAAGDPTICDRLYLEGVRPTCRAYYASRTVTPTAANSPTLAPLPTATPTATLSFPVITSPSLTATPAPTTVTTTLGWHDIDILFSYNHDGATELWTIDPASGAVQQQIRPEQTVLDPALSPSGEAIAYVRVTGDYGGVVSELWLMDKDGANPRPLYVPPAGQSVLSHPAWQPDGQELYVIQTGYEGSDTLLRIPANGREPTPIRTDCLDFALSPTGEWLVSVSLGRQLTISGRDGTRLRDIEPQGAAFTDYYSLAVSPDGNLLAFQATEAAGEDTWNLYVMDWRGRDVRRLTDLKGFHPFTSSSGEVNGLAWTADGAHLLYSVNGHAEQSGIWLIDVDDRQTRRLFAWQEGEWAAVRGPWFEQTGTPPSLSGEQAQALLDDYSQTLSSGQIGHEGFYSEAMLGLINERRAYYQEFHQVALHSSLLGISSRYELDSVAPDAVEDGLYHIQAVEMVTTTGRYREPTPGEYTSTRAALWALARTDHPAVQQALQEYITREMARYLARVNTASNYDTVWIVRHQLLIRAGESGSTIMEDTFDDKASDNTEGFDVVNWVDGRFVRHKPDWTGFPDYVMYHEPLEKVEALGRSLLQDKTRTYGGTPAPDPHPGWLTYTHATYGFSFRYPPDWTVVSQPDVPNLVRLRYREPAVLELTVGFRWSGEEAPIQRAGFGAGEIEAQGTVRFLGRELPRQVLIYEGRVKAILYSNAQEIDVDGLIFTLSLDDRNSDYDAAQIEPEMQAIVDEIVESFLLSSD